MNGTHEKTSARRRLRRILDQVAANEGHFDVLLSDFEEALVQFEHGVLHEAEEQQPMSVREQARFLLGREILGGPTEPQVRLMTDLMKASLASDGVTGWRDALDKVFEEFPRPPRMANTATRQEGGGADD